MAEFASESIAFLLGILVHRYVFARGEWHLRATTVMYIHFLSCAFLCLISSRHMSYSSAIEYTSLMTLSYGVGLCGSIAIYRILFHRLREFPGPFFARVTKLWHVSHCLDSKNYLLMDDMHKRYGDYVRTGPSELTIFHPDTLHTIYDSKTNPFTKPAWYDNLRPYTGLNTHRSRWVHEHRRRIWDRAFSTKALSSYEQDIRVQADQLEKLIFERLALPIVINDFFYWFSWDVMGILAFSKSFQMLQGGKWHHAIKMLRKGLELVGPFTPVPWLTRIAFDVPILPTVRNFLKMGDWCARSMDERINSGSETADVSSYLIDWSNRHDRLAKDLHTLYGDSVALIIAGSDTVAFTLVYIFYYLAKDPAQITKLREEQDGVDLRDFRSLQKLPHLRGVINEVLRLHPAVPTGGFRETPPEGAEIGGKWIPGNTLICAPRWTIGKLESCFVQALDFIPERWYSRPDMIVNKKAFAPFALGNYYCIGKNLAYMEMQYVTSLLVSKYDIQFAPGEDGKAVINDMVDQFTAAPGKLRLVCSQRKR